MMNMSMKQSNEPNQYNTSDERFFVYSLNEKKEIDDFIGPAFSEEIEECLQEFDEDENPQVIDEKAFRLLYYEDYKKDFIICWSDYICYLLESLGYNVDIVCLIDEDEKLNNEFESDYETVCILGVGYIEKQDNKLYIQFDLAANPYDSAFISLELQKYCESIFEVQIGAMQHIDDTGNIHYDEEAKIVYENEKLNIVNLN